MKFCVISDTHSLQKYIAPRILDPADCIIHAGDVSNRGRKNEVLDFMAWFSSLTQYKYKIFIAGNHDFLFETDPDMIKTMLAQYPDIIYLQDSAVEIEGVKIYGSPWQPRFFNWAFNVDRGEKIAKIWELIPEGTDIVVTHGPIFGYGDIALDGRRVGCEDLLNRMKIVKPKFHISGHIHSGHGMYNVNEVDGLVAINASLVDEEYQVVYEPIYFELNKISELPADDADTEVPGIKTN